jgi:hypothetical protein
MGALYAPKQVERKVGARPPERRDTSRRDQNHWKRKNALR